MVKTIDLKKCVILIKEIISVNSNQKLFQNPVEPKAELFVTPVNCQKPLTNITKDSIPGPTRSCNCA